MDPNGIGYSAYGLRIFVVEQACPYLEADDKDPQCWHLELLHHEQLIGTLRVAPPGVSYQSARLAEWRFTLTIASAA